MNVGNELDKTMDKHSANEQSHHLMDAASRLAGRALFMSDDSISQRIAGTGQIAVLRSGQPQPQFVLLTSDSADPWIRRHLDIYRRRPDVGAVLFNRPNWTLALGALGRPMPGVFDEQVRHLGDGVALTSKQSFVDDGMSLLDQGANALVLQDSVLCLGMTLDRAVFNAELLEKCAKAFVLASGTGKPVGSIPWLVRFIAKRRLRKDQRYAASEYAQGRVPVFKSAY
jgi:hypothetical protein